MITKKITHVELNERVDTLKPGQWWVWSCEVTYDDGSTAEGFIESDEHMHSLESFDAFMKL